MEEMERDEKYIVMLELLAGSSIFLIAVVVLCLVLHYRLV